jgi:hypothetical protein
MSKRLPKDWLVDIVDFFVFGILEETQSFPSRLLRFAGIFFAYIVLIMSFPIWGSLAIIVGILDIWEDTK